MAGGLEVSSRYAMNSDSPEGVFNIHGSSFIPFPFTLELAMPNSTQRTIINLDGLKKDGAGVSGDWLEREQDNKFINGTLR